MPADPDANLRAYVLKKQQARERAKKLREERLQQRSESTTISDEFNSKHLPTTRIIGDPFASATTHVEVSFGKPAITPREKPQENTVNETLSLDTTNLHSENFVSKEEFERWVEIVQRLQEKMQNLHEKVQILTAENNSLRNIVVQRESPKKIDSTKSAQDSISHDWEPATLSITPQSNRSNTSQRTTSKRSTPTMRKGDPNGGRKKNDRNKMTNQLSALKKRSSRKNLHSPPRIESPPVVESRPSLSMSSRNSIPFDQMQEDEVTNRSTPREVMAVLTSSEQSPSSPPDEFSEDLPIRGRSNGQYPQSFDEYSESEPVVQPIARQSEAIVSKGGYNLDNLPDALPSEDPGPRQQCPDCGRKFIAKAMAKHRRICRKVFGQKRKPMDMKKKLYDKDALQAKRTSGVTGGRGRSRGRGRGRGRAINPAGKSAKWKNQSSSLRQAIRAARLGADAPFEPTPEDLDTRIPCPHCGRKFAEATAERHIPKCRTIKAKPKTLRRKR